MKRCEKVSDFFSVGARSWLRCDWSIYNLGRGLAKDEFLCSKLLYISTPNLKSQLFHGLSLFDLN